MDSALMWTALVILVFVLAISLPDGRNRRLERRLRELDRKLDLLLAHQGISDERPGMTEVDELVRRGEKVKAIKVYRQLTGAGLVEAKEAVERRHP
ncbi:ribosomal protein L7/L12 [Streptomyces sp. NPDC000151]|uniref:ribosomal protein L7/L12 n=1 Tax=Streptomyces sp. NPDC000151 TaxID=3154244 RepID=UPI00331678DB